MEIINKQVFKQLSKIAGKAEQRSTILITSLGESIEIQGKILFPNQITREFGEIVVSVMYEVVNKGVEKCIYHCTSGYPKVFIDLRE